MKKFLLVTFTLLLFLVFPPPSRSQSTIYTCSCQTDYSTGAPRCQVFNNGCGVYLPAVCQNVINNTCGSSACECQGAPNPPPPPTNTPKPPPPTTPVPTTPPPPPSGCCRGALQCGQFTDITDCQSISNCYWDCTVPTSRPAPTTNPNACCQPDPAVGNCQTNCNQITLYNSCAFSNCCQWVASANCPVSTPINSCCRAISPAGQYSCAPYIVRTFQNYLSCTGQPTNCQWTCEPYDLPTPIPTRPVPRVFCTPPNGGPSDNPNAGGIWTNLGCVPYESKSFAAKAMEWGVNLAGGIALIVIGFAAFLYVSSGGDPKKVQAARELIIALVGGIALIIFAVLLLNYLGVNLLDLENLGFKG